MRLASIDILRAITMVLMIWVNDFWTLTNVPKWLKHANSVEDYLGFSDIIFPLFLFIVGLSIPLAIKNRIDKGYSNISISKHIVVRSISLLIITDKSSPNFGSKYRSFIFSLYLSKSIMISL